MAAGAAQAATPKEGPPTTFVTEEEMTRAVVVRGIPMAEHGRTTDALLGAFRESFGRVTRLIVQASDAPAPGRTGTQHAVVIFAEPSAAEAALTYSGRHILASPVTVQAADALEVGDPESPTGDAAAGDNPRRPLRAVATLLADGYFAGEKGLAYVSGVSERLGVTRAFQQAADSLSRSTREFAEAHNMADKVGSMVASAQQRATKLDEAFGLREAAAQAGEKLSAAAASLGERALRSNLIARSVEGVQSLARQTVDAIGMTAVATRVEIADRRQKQEDPAAQTAAPAAPEGGQSADEAQPSDGDEAAAGVAHAVEPVTPAAPEEDDGN